MERLRMIIFIVCRYYEINVHMQYIIIPFNLLDKERNPDYNM